MDYVQGSQPYQTHDMIDTYLARANHSGQPRSIMSGLPRHGTTHNLVRMEGHN
jgi:hypothetical protein